MSDRFRRDFLALYAVAAVYLILGWFHWRFVFVPAKPDEIQHLAYIADIRRGHLWPIRSPATDTPCGLDERWQPPLYYWISALIAWPTPISWPGEWVVPNPFLLVGAPRGNAAQCLQFPPGNLPLFTVRIWSWLLGVLGVSGTYRLARAWMAPPGAALAALLAATIPSAIFYQTGVNNTALFVPLSALALSEMVWGWQRGLSDRRLRRLFLFTIASIYTRLEGLLLLPPLFLLGIRSWRRGHPIRKWLTGSAALLLTAALLWGRHWWLYGDPFFRSGLAQRAEPRPLIEWLRQEGPLFFRAVFVNLGHGLILAPDWIYGMIGAALVAGGIGLVWRVVRRELPSAAGLPALYAAVLASATVAIGLRHFVGGPRYIASAGAAWVPLWVAGYLRLWPRAIRRAGIAAGTVTIYLLNVIVIAQILLPVYMPRPALPADPPLAYIAEGIVLHRARIEPVRARPGEIVTVHLVWEARRPIPDNYAVFVHVLDPEVDRILAQSDTFPLYGHYPTMLWRSGQPFEEVHRIRLPAHLDVRRVRLTAGLYRYETGQRLPAYSPQGTRFQGGGGDAIPIGWIELEPAP